MKTALYIGRFQPFHIGHYSVLQNLVEQGFTHCLIGIGSSQYQRTPTNPLTYQERRAWIEDVLEKKPLPLMVAYLAIPDIHDNAAWVAHVQKLVYTLTPYYDTVVSGNQLVQQLFTAAGVPVQGVQMTIPITGTQLRQWIRENNPRWQEYVERTIANRIVSIIKTSQ